MTYEANLGDWVSIIFGLMLMAVIVATAVAVKHWELRRDRRRRHAKAIILSYEAMRTMPIDLVAEYMERLAPSPTAHGFIVCHNRKSDNEYDQ